MSRRILCIWHTEKTPSLVVDDDGWGYCHGCHRHGQVDTGVVGQVREELPPEDLQASLARIRGLSTGSVRGLTFPMDERGYYIVWPEWNYYKLRLWDNQTDKYRCPVGHEKPLLVFDGARTDTLLLVEGEINAISIHTVAPNRNVCSPGSSGDFYSMNKLRTYLHHYLKYDTIIILADDDKAGAKAAIELTAVLRNYPGKKIKIHLWKQDANEVLVTHGWEALGHEVEALLDM